MKRLAIAVLMAGAAFAPPGAAGNLTVYFIDAEGGHSTLVVTPTGQSLLVDSGYAGFDDRDPNRILAAARDAGLTRVDYLLTTHFHVDHDGGVPAVAARLPVRTFVDYGSLLQTETIMVDAFKVYQSVRAKGQHLQPKPGDRIPITGAEVEVVSAGGETLSTPLAGAGQPNAACASFERQADDPTENSRSIGVRVRVGRFRFVDMGDLMWNRLGQLACPYNSIGQIDAYAATHHGYDDAAVPALLAALRPRVTVVGNGPTKGGMPEAMRRLFAISGRDGVWQLHHSLLDGAENTDESQIANLDEPDAGHFVKLTASTDGSFIVTNGRTGFQRRYPAPAATSARP